MDENDLISVIIPAYKCAATLSRALDSVYSQTYSPLEVIIIDDASPDDQEKAIAHYSAVKYHRLPKNVGAAAARNVGIQLAKGKYLAFLDADDEWLPEKLTKQMDLMKRSPLKPMLVTCNSAWIGNSEASKSTNYYLSHIPSRGSRVWFNLLSQNFIPTPTVLVASEVFKKVKPFDESLKVAEDLDLWIRISQQFPVDYLEEVLVRFHLRRGSLMDTTAYGTIPITLSVIEKHCLQGSEKLSKAEVDQILGQRYHAYTYEFYRGGRYKDAINYGWKCLKYSHRRVKTMAILVLSLMRSWL